MTTVAQPDMVGFEAEEVAMSSRSMRFFPGGQRADLLDKVVHLARFSTMVVNVTGEPGTGKSYLLEAVKTSLPEGCISLKASLLMSSTELLQQMLHQLMASRFHHDTPELPVGSDEESLLSIVGSYLLRVSDVGSNIVLLIDDAHELSEDAIQMLLRLLLDKKYVDTVRCILFSESYLTKVLEKPEVKAAGGEQVFSMVAPLMDRASTADYLFFLESAKPESERILYSDADINMIYELSEGRLGQVNAAIRSLLEREPSITKSNGPFSKAQYLLLGLFVFVLVGVGIFYQIEKKHKLEQIDVLSETKPEIIRIESEELNPAGDKKEIVEKSTSSSLLEQLRIKQQELDGGSVVQQGDDLATSLEGSVVIKAEQLQEEKVEDVVVPSSIDAVDSVVESNKTMSDKLPDTEGSEAVEEKGSEDWIAAQPANHFTIQILGAHSKKNVSTYVSNYKGDTSGMVVYEGILRNQPWFVLIHGSYENREAAKNAGTKLGLKDVWIRSFSSVQKERIH